MIEVDQKLYRMLTPRTVVLIGSTSPGGRKHIAAINNITSVSLSPGMLLVAIYKEQVTRQNLETAKGFTISILQRTQLQFAWKLSNNYPTGTGNEDEMQEYEDNLDVAFSAHGPVLKDALAWIECDIVARPNGTGADHFLAIGKYAKIQLKS